MGLGFRVGVRVVMLLGFRVRVRVGLVSAFL